MRGLKMNGGKERVEDCVVRFFFLLDDEKIGEGRSDMRLTKWMNTGEAKVADALRIIIDVQKNDLDMRGTTVMETDLFRNTPENERYQYVDESETRQNTSAMHVKHSPQFASHHPFSLTSAL
jgi:hypothetical protein